MKITKSVLWAFILMIVVTAVSRYMTYNVAGFAPQMAMALFGGAVIRNKKWAFLTPLLSLFISDCIFQIFYEAGISERAGFYNGQWMVYLCFVVVTVYGFLMKKINVKNVLFFSISGSVLFFTLSNFFVWLGGGGLGRPATFDGLMLCYWDALTYYRDYGLIKGFLLNQALGDLIWCTALFGVYYLVAKYFLPAEKKLA